MPPHWLIVLMVAGVVALPLTAVFGWLAVKVAEWYWNRQDRRVRPG